MASSAHDVVPSKVTTETPKVHWPLSYRMQPQKPKASSLQSYGFSSTQAAPKRWWSHRLYRGPGGKEVEILYSKTKAQSETYAKQFLDEPVIGFDMEWPWNDWKRDDLQNKIGLIQIASEDKIALFHIGLHPGKTSEEIIAPTLKRILEDPKIGKVGVRNIPVRTAYETYTDSIHVPLGKCVEGGLLEVEPLLWTQTKRCCRIESSIPSCEVWP